MPCIAHDMCHNIIDFFSLPYSGSAELGILSSSRSKLVTTVAGLMIGCFPLKPLSALRVVRSWSNHNRLRTKLIVVE